jgi:hypothetical protein
MKKTDIKTFVVATIILIVISLIDFCSKKLRWQDMTWTEALIEGPIIAIICSTIVYCLWKKKGRDK